jgi:hypothetical protein
MKAITTIQKLFLIITFLTFQGSGISMTITSISSGEWSNPLIWDSGFVPNFEDDVIIDSLHEVELVSNAQCHDLTINSVGSLEVSDFRLTIYGEAPAASALLLTTCFSELVIEDAGNEGQFVLPNKVILLQKLTINRSAGVLSNHDLVLANCVPPTDSVVLELIHGVLFLTPRDVTKLIIGSISYGFQTTKDIPCSDSSYVDGLVQRVIIGGGTYTFPVGQDGKCRKFGISQESLIEAGVHTVQFLNGQPRNYTCFNYNIEGGVSDKYAWKHKKTIGPRFKVRIYYNDLDFNLTASQKQDLTIANGELLEEAVCPPDTEDANRWSKVTSFITVNDSLTKKFIESDSLIQNGETIIDNADVVLTGSDSSTDFNGNSGDNTSDGYLFWTIGSLNSNTVLPIELASIEAECISNSFFNLVWTTSSETENLEFVIEKTTNGQNFVPLETVSGKGVDNEIQEYEVKLRLEDVVSYYRLKQINSDGDVTYSPLVSADCHQEMNVDFYPNPAQMQISFTSLTSTSTVSIFNTLGRLVQNTAVSKTNPIMQLQDLDNGIYTIQFNSGNKLIQKRLVIKN